MSDPGDRQRRQAEQYRAFIEDDQHPRYPPYTSLHALPRSTTARDDRPADGLIFGIDVGTGQIASRDAQGRIRLARPCSSGTDIVADIIRWRDILTAKTTPVPTPKPRRANTESDTMTDEATTTEAEATPTPEPTAAELGELTADQHNRGNTVTAASAILSTGGGITGAFSGTRLPERFGVDDILDVSEYLRAGIITTRRVLRDETIIDRYDPANPDPTEEYVEEHIKTRAAFQKLADKVTERRIPIPFDDAFMVAIDKDAPNDELIGAVKEARRVLKGLVTERGLKL